MTEPKLDLLAIENYSLDKFTLLDTSIYPEGFTPVNPSIEITPPGYDKITLPFTARSLQVYKSSMLGIVCPWCDEVDLPDGLWKFKFSLYPANKYYTEVTTVRVSRLQSKLDEFYINLDLSCERMCKKDKTTLNEVQGYIEGAISAGNKCVFTLFDTYYQKATKILKECVN